MKFFSNKIMQFFRRIYYAFFCEKSNDQGPVFIVGTGRSGTHFLCSCLSEFDCIDDVYQGRESPHFFYPITELVLAQRPLGKAELGYYRKKQLDVKPGLFLDQTHPNIWNVDQLLEIFPRAKFVAISRNVYSVVYSMLMHEGVLGWVENHKNYPRPNRFLGITKSNEDLYDNHLDDMQRCVFRWCAHEDRIREIVSDYPESVMSISYEELYSDMRMVMSNVASFLGVSEPESYMEFKSDSLYKKNLLTECQVANIDEAMRLYWGGR